MNQQAVISLRPRAGLYIVLITLLVAPAAWGQAPAEDPFALGVRNTEPITAEEQLKTFRVPEGFSVRLVAAEPDIAKPMNLAFDDRGRMWVSSSLEYPFAAVQGTTPRDTIRILEDTDGDSRADKVTVFADELNIPIGLIPYGEGVICFSIPNIWYLRDTDGDDRCDVREILYGPFDTTRDTHGMCNAFRQGEDGWIYACHGFNNQSHVKGRDGHEVHLLSGNTFRFRPDGSRIEMVTQGQVNPFGMAIDDDGDFYTADCHTKPVTLLLPGGCYESFGRPHDGLGFVPNVMDHLHGSTAIAALALGAHTTFPDEYSSSTFDGNVMTSRINRNVLQRTGSSVLAIEQPDLVASSDPWFRPVDLVAGPDGSLYVADFYNRIIGHYEVDLMHPGRDRFRGRIWRISWDGGSSPNVTGYGLNLSTPRRSPAELMEIARTRPFAQRMLARQMLAGDTSDSTTAFLRTSLSDSDPLVRRQALRLLAERKSLTAAELTKAAQDSNERVRIHAFRALREWSSLPESSAILKIGFRDESAMVRRAAASAAATHPEAAKDISVALIRLLHTTDLRDVHLRHTIRISLRDLLRDESVFRDVAAASPLMMDRRVIADLSLAIKSDAAAEFVAANVETLATAEPARLADYLQFAAAKVSAETADQVVRTVRQRYSKDLNLQQKLLSSIRLGFSQRSQIPPNAVRDWALEVALGLMQMKSPQDLDALNTMGTLSWNYIPHPDSPQRDNCWTVTHSRNSSDGVNGAALYSSFEAGERRTGIYRSEPFTAGSSLGFFVAGHDGFPTAPLKKANVIRLRDADSSEILFESSPPRNDVAQPVEWNTEPHRGKRVFVELVDGDTATAYAWLAVGRFTEQRLNPSDVELRQRTAAEIAAEFTLQELNPALCHLLESSSLSRATLSSLAPAAVRLQPHSLLAAVALIPSLSQAPDSLVRSASQAVARHQIDQCPTILEEAFRTATSAEQLRLAEQLASDQTGTDELLRLMEAGRASSRLLLRPSVIQRLQGIGSEEQKARFMTIRETLPNEDELIEKMITERRRAMRQGMGNPSEGREVFRKNCLACHQVAGEGKQVGPNLDGIGNRGAERILEDLLAPNRNVDVAFRSSTLVTREGKAFSGLARELEGNRIRIVDSQGKETILSADEIEDRVASTASPMPANLGETLNPQQFRDLMSWLLTLKASELK